MIPDYIASNNKYVYHTTKSDNVESIIENGIKTGKTNPDSRIISNTLKEYPEVTNLPFDRLDCSYFHINADYINKTRNMMNKKSIVVVDISKIESDMYISDMSIISDVLDYSVMKSIPEFKIKNTIEKYQNNIYKINSIDDISNNNIMGHVELLIVENIKPDAIELIIN